MSQAPVDPENPPSLRDDIRLIFATILTDPGSSLAYGADALLAVTVVLIQRDYTQGMIATFAAGGIVMGVYFVAILVYNSMTKHHVHPILGGGAFVSSHITSEQIRTPWLKRAVQLMGRTGTASLLSDFPATQAISLIAGVEALYFIPAGDRLYYAFGFLVFLSLVQRYGLGNLARYMIWPVILFYTSNMAIQFFGLSTILDQGWAQPTLIPHEDHGEILWLLVFKSVANGATLITGVEVGYSSVNFPHHKGKAIRISMWMLYAIVIVTYSLQLVNFLGLGIDQTVYSDLGHLPPVPIQIAQHLGGDMIAVPFGLITAVMLLLAAQTAQSDFPLEILRASRSGFFPRAVGDTAWKKTKAAPLIGGHDGVYNPRATLLLGVLSLVILIFFPHSHDIESMYGLAVVTAMCIDIASYLLRQIRVRKVSPLTVFGLVIMVLMFFNILLNKFFDGAWFIVVLIALYMIVFLFSEAVYKLWNEKMNMVPLQLGLWYPLFQACPVDRKNIVLVSNFHPGVIHFLKNYVRSGKMPLALHFHSDATRDLPDNLPEWFEVVTVPQGQDTITTITNYIREAKPDRVHLIPLLVSGVDPVKKYYFGNSIEALKHAISQYADLQVEYNRERVRITAKEILWQIFPSLKRRALRRGARRPDPKWKALAEGSRKDLKADRYEKNAEARRKARQTKSSGKRGSKVPVSSKKKSKKKRPSARTGKKNKKTE